MAMRRGFGPTTPPPGPDAMLARLRQLGRWVSGGHAAVPEGLRVYAIGDIHGRADLVAELHAAIAGDAAEGAPPDRTVVYLGDYVDRGRESARALDLVMAGPGEGFRTVPLKGNHEAILEWFLDDPVAARDWLDYGGAETLASYAVRVPLGELSEAELVDLARHLRAAMPPAHLGFLAGLRLSVDIGDYRFVHAGVAPDIPMDEQSADDLLWIREGFLDATADFGKVIVHGHTASRRPVVRANRIGIDTGAYITGRLTCLVLEGSGVRFLST